MEFNSVQRVGAFVQHYEIWSVVGPPDESVRHSTRQYSPVRFVQLVLVRFA
jgi:hypothetical protein